MEKLRTVRFSPYRNLGPTFTLVTWDAGYDHIKRRNMIAYRLTQTNAVKTGRWVLFEGEDFGCSPMHAIDSDDAIRGLMAFLTLRPGDTDADYFAHYTEEQLAFCAEHAEALAGEVADRFGEE